MKNGLLLETSMVAFGGVIVPLAIAVPADARTYDVASGQTSVVSSVISSNVSGVTITGGGTVEFKNTSNSYVKETVVEDNSTLSIHSEYNLGSTGGITLGDSTTSGVLSYDTSGNQISASQTNDHGILINAGGGTIVTNAGTVVSSGTASVTSKYTVDLAGVISGTGQLTVTGGGTLELSGDNVWTGGTLVEDGSTLEIGKQYNLGASTNTLTLNDGTLRFYLGRTVDDPITLGSGGGTVNVYGHKDTLGGVITGSGSLTVADSDTTSSSSGGTSKTTGTLILNRDETYTGGTVVEGGALELSSASLSGNVTVTTATYSKTVLSGSNHTSSVTSSTSGTFEGIGTVDGTLTVSSGGTVSPGINGSGTLTVSDYVQSSGSTLVIDLGSGTSSELVVENDATLAGDLKLQYAGYTSAGTYTYFKAGSTTGSFTSVTDDLESAGLTSDVEGDTVTLTQNSHLPSGDLPTLFTAATNAAVDESQFATRLVLDRLQTVRTTALAQREQVALSDHHQVRNLSPYGLWVAPLGGFGSTRGNDGAGSYSTSKYGAAIGYDKAIAAGWANGIVLQYVHQKVSENGGGYADVNTPRIEIYTSFWRGPYAVDLVLGDGAVTMDTHRAVDASLTSTLNGTSTTTAYHETATGKRTANAITAALAASGNYLIRNRWAIAPELGVRAAHLTVTGVTESGTDYFDYRINGQRLTSVRPFVAVQGSRRLYFSNGSALLPSLTLGVEDEVGSRNRALTAQTFGDSYVWTIPGVKTASLAADINLGLAYETSKQQSFSIKFMGTESAGSTDQTFVAQYGLRF